MNEHNLGPEARKHSHEFGGNELGQPLDPSLIRTRKQGNDQVEFASWADCALALDAALPLLWSRTILELPKAEVEVVTKTDAKGNAIERYVAYARAVVRLELGPLDAPWAVHEDLGYCDSPPQKTSHAALAFAEEGAISNALRRCARVLGPRLGLGLKWDEDQREALGLVALPTVPEDAGEGFSVNGRLRWDPEAEHVMAPAEDQEGAPTSASSPSAGAAPSLPETGQASDGSTTYMPTLEQRLRAAGLPEGQVMQVVSAAVAGQEDLTDLARELWKRCAKAKSKAWALATFEASGFSPGNGEPDGEAVGIIAVALHRANGA